METRAGVARHHLDEAVAALQAAVPVTQHASEDAAAGSTLGPPPPASLGPIQGAGAGAARNPHGYVDHDDFNISQGRRWRRSRRHRHSWQTVSATLPFPAMFCSRSRTHASQLLSGLGQAHPSISFPQFSGENPNLWKTLYEQYFHMCGIVPTFWVPMTALNFSGPASIWLQSIQK